MKHKSYLKIKVLNNIIELDHRFIKKKINLSKGFGNFKCAEATLFGYEALHMMHKNQLGIKYQSALELFNHMSTILSEAA